MLVYGATVFLSAFLLFLVQPLIGKFVLPWFGGSPAVWTTCMLFFQVLLLAGYAYAHALASRLPLSRQARVHMTLLAATTLAVVWLSIAPSPWWKPVDDQSPVLGILGLLTATIGAPFFLLSATAPLLQSWFSRTRSAPFPYRLYALSNLGSLLAILSYPFLIEPAMSLHRQAVLWGWAFAALAILAVLLARQVMAVPAGAPDAVGTTPARGGDAAADAPGRREYVLWLGLTACSSVMLLATTSTMSQDLAVVPLLWILPLALYLLSFVICFQHERLYWRPLFAGGLVASAAWTVYVLEGSVFVPLRWQILSYSLTLFFSCMVCHGELVRLRPAPRYLTSFYLMVAGGGAIGGFLVTVVATRLLTGFWEYHLGLLATTLLALWILVWDRRGSLNRSHPLPARALWGALGIAWILLASALGRDIRDASAASVESARNFFGVLRVQELFKDDPGQHQFNLMHGRIEHGFQFVAPEKHNWPVGYYSPYSGMGVALLLHPRRTAAQSLRIGAIGLGAGISAVYGRPGDVIRYYEINPEVVRLSDKYFSYRRDSKADTDVVLGDARVSLERQRDRGQSEQFDVLIVDAFSSDAIPVHLLTREAFAVYRHHLKTDGILAFHITSRYFDLSPVVRNLIVPGAGEKMGAFLVQDSGHPQMAADATRWVLLTANSGFLNNPQVQALLTGWSEPVPRPVVWTDDYSNVISVIHERSAEQSASRD